MYLLLVQNRRLFVKENKNSEARIKANNKYNAKTYDTMSIKVKKGKREYYKSAAKELGYDSFNKFVISAMNEKINKRKK